MPGQVAGVPSYLVDRPESFNDAWLDGVNTIGLTAGASAPEKLVQDTIARIRQVRPVIVETHDGLAENVKFRLPPRLQAARTINAA